LADRPPGQPIKGTLAINWAAGRGTNPASADDEIRPSRRFAPTFRTIEIKLVAKLSKEEEPNSM
jgi:hypothetical protein